MKSIVAAIAALAVAAVSAQQGIVSVTSPTEGTVFTAGEDARIAWINANVDTISQIELANGDPANLNHLDVIATGIDAESGEYTWSIPSSIQPGTDYALIFGDSPDVAYSPRFSIQAGNGTAPTSSAPSAPASSSDSPSSTAQPSPSSSTAASSSASSSAASSSKPSSQSASSSGAAAEQTDSGALRSQPGATMAVLAVAGAAAIAMV